MKRTFLLLRSSNGVGNMSGQSFSSDQQGSGFDIYQQAYSGRSKTEILEQRVQQEYSGKEWKARTKVQNDNDTVMSRNIVDIPPYPSDSVHASSTARRTGILFKFPTRKYPNPKKHRPVMVTPQVNLMRPYASPHTLVTRNRLPLEKVGKKYIQKIEYLRPIPPKKKVRSEMYNRLKHGLLDLDRIMPPLYGAQEGYKLDRDEWLFKTLYFFHPIREEDLVDKVESFPHNPFDNAKDIILGLERLVSREFVRRVKGVKLNHPDVDPHLYYWTLMPDELEFGEKIVVEENYLQMIKEGKPITAPIFPIREEMVTNRYQEKHNTYMYFDEIQDIEELQSFVAFCKSEKEDTEKKLDAINCKHEFPEDDDMAEPPVYPDPPTMLTRKRGKISWHAVGHWRESVPDGKTGVLPRF
eukprot:TRINITY_DN8434_c0_g1_i1.p1 TRINITY_DN8434_c0_g1~~TRINITY_DN8434_c0_g1_i1.p1  ORF type:complete len:411 (+),score=93.56 TRINITY_DN8434_c0_g1_i1:826-2058(+)